ncbi:MAG TPA: DUF1800 domain-containing protein [Acidimicrobiia bacterium]|nr:DUF1800 domain-containing protein [Acidimicrobiia bacterium]
MSKRDVAHVLRRLSIGVHPRLVATLDSADAAVARALDLSAPAPAPLDFPAPTDFASAREIRRIVEPVTWWLEQMRSNPRLIEERLVWFWHDHFATSLQKVRVPYLMYQQQLTIRKHATGSFAELLHAIAKDPAMLLFLDGVTNSARKRNENFGREVMELFTVGRGRYTQDDVVAASRAFTGWVVDIPGRPGLERAAAFGIPPWQSGLVPRRHDAGVKTLLGRTGAFDLDGALDVLLDHPATAPRIAAKLYTELVGSAPDERTAARLGTTLRDHDWQVMPVVETIVHDPAFTSPAARGARVRTPVEKLVGLMQAFPESLPPGTAAAAGRALRTIGYVPFVPPNVGGYPKGTRLLGPHQLVHAFDLLSVFPTAPNVPRRVDDLFAALGLYGVSDRTHAVVSAERDPGRRLALAVASPEYSVG